MRFDMKTIEEMTDLELAETLMWIAAEFDSDSGDDYDADVLSWLAEAKRRLSAPPAQRIADLTGCVVTKDPNGEWNIHRPGFVPETTISEVTFPDGSYKDHEMWSVDDSVDCSYTLIRLPDDNRPWQESIYRPKGK
jgi:hypothetical protein